MNHTKGELLKVIQEEQVGLIEDQAMALNILFTGKQLYILRWKDLEELFSALGVVQKKISPITVSASFNGVNAEFVIPRVGEPVPRKLALSVRKFLVEAGKDMFV